jgi:hypothetical protein
VPRSGERRRSTARSSSPSSQFITFALIIYLALNGSIPIDREVGETLSIEKSQSLFRDWLLRRQRKKVFRLFGYLGLRASVRLIVEYLLALLSSRFL